VPEHMRVYGEGQFGGNAGARDQLAHPIGAHGAAPLGHKDEPAVLEPLAGQLPKCSQLIPLQRVGGGGFRSWLAGRAAGRL
jgi:hypothetical protein